MWPTPTRAVPPCGGARAGARPPFGCAMRVDAHAATDCCGAPVQLGFGLWAACTQTCGARHGGLPAMQALKLAGQSAMATVQMWQ